MIIDSTTIAPDLVHRLASVARQLPEGCDVSVRAASVHVRGLAGTWGRMAEICGYAHSLITWPEGEDYVLMLASTRPGSWSAHLFTTDEHYHQITGRTNCGGSCYHVDGVAVTVIPLDSWERSGDAVEAPF